MCPEKEKDGIEIEELIFCAKNKQIFLPFLKLYAA